MFGIGQDRLRPVVTTYAIGKLRRPTHRAQPDFSHATLGTWFALWVVIVTPLLLRVRRAVDILFASSALVLLSPLCLLVAAAIRLTSPGPVIFRQLRAGLHGRHFWMLKFRSMVVDAEARKAHLAAFNEMDGPAFKMSKDPRVTTVGRFLRKTSLDELPQLWNILRGEMSVVGPRPVIVEEAARYEPWQRRRLSMPPGMTCLWQISGRNELPFEEWMRLDLQYVDNWSLWLDLKIACKTIPAVLLGRGAK